jgi:hypothetical protein
MTPMRWAITLFWVFIGIMLIKQFYDYDQGRQKQLVAHPTPQHYFFNATTPPEFLPPAAKNPHLRSANVHQMRYWVEDHSGSTGSFTAYVVLKNLGNAKATGIQAQVRPYRGSMMGDVDGGHSSLHALSDNDPMSQFGQWINAPDLAPGESTTQTVVFVNHPGYGPGSNPSPQILFETEKTNP